jgi:hypothetical protein
MFGVSEDDQVGEGMNGNGGVPDTVEKEGELLSKVYVVDSGLLKSGVGELDGRDDLVAVGLEGKSSIEDGAKVGELGDFGDGERGTGRGEVPGEEPWTCDSCTAVGRGLVEDDDFRLEGGNG